MKTRKMFFLAMFLLALFSSCEQVEAFNDSSSEIEYTVNDGQSQVIAFTSNPDSITENEVNGLIIMREEEKLAMDVYTYFYNKYNYRIFGNISKSENRHTDAVLNLINYFKLTDPASASEGSFSNTDFQTLYTKLTSEATTIELALSTGAFVEEYDIADLNKLIAESKNPDIKRVYINLLNGSGNHLRAFTRVLAGLGVVYKPTILTLDEYNSILAD